MAPPRRGRGGQAPRGQGAPRNNRGSDSEESSSSNSPPLGNNPPSNPNIIAPAIKLLDTKNYTNVCQLIERDHLSNDNWHDWTHLMKRIFKNCEITKYIDGTIQCPDQLDYPGPANNWSQNDSWAQQVILQNITPSQLHHVATKETGRYVESSSSYS